MGIGILGPQEESGLERRGPVRLDRDAPAVGGPDNRVAAVVVVAVLVVGVRGGYLGQGAILGWGRHPQLEGGADAVAEERLAAGAVIVEAVQELQTGDGVVVHEVLV